MLVLKWFLVYFQRMFYNYQTISILNLIVEYKKKKKLYIRHDYMKHIILHEHLMKELNEKLKQIMKLENRNKKVKKLT